MRIILSTDNWFMFGHQDYILPWKLTLIRDWEELKKKMNFVFHLIGVYIVSIDLSCIWQVTRSQNFTIQIMFVCADKAAPLKHCRIKVKSYSSALTVFPFSRSKVFQLFMRGYPVRMWMDDQVMLFSHEADDMI